jgi:sedoheptulokinase
MQLSLLMPKDYIPTKKSESENKSIDYFPYFENRYLSVAASLNGGNVLQSFVKTLKSITQQISGVNVSEEKIWDKLLQSSENMNSQQKDNDNNKVIVKPTLFGERHDTNLKASIINISDSLELNEIFGAICSGLIDNIFEMMSIAFLEKAGIQRLIGTGSALLRNPILKDVLERKLNIPVIYIDGNDADVGSAWVAFAYYSKSLHLLNDISTQY